MLFDSVHIFKSVRNNWMNQTDCNQTFIFPDFNLPNSFRTASLSHLKSLLNKEENEVVKLAPALNRKVLYPTSVERQNVNLCVKLFDEKNVAALQVTKDENDYAGTIMFMDLLIKWWKIVNCNFFYKDKRYNDQYYSPISSIDCHNIIFLDKMLKWLQSWDNMFTVVPSDNRNANKIRSGKLSADTQLSLTQYHSTL